MRHYLCMFSNTLAFVQNKSLYSESACFQKKELNKILNIYGRMVSIGEWRDYGISVFRDFSVFTVYKGYGESPIYIIEKRPKLSKKNGKFSVIGIDGAILKRANDIEIILAFFSRKLMKISKFP